MTRGRSTYHSYVTAVALTPDDATDLARVPAHLVAAVAGNINLTTVDGDTVIVAVAAGMILPLETVRVWAASTTATGITALYR